MQRPFRDEYTDVRPASFFRRLMAMIYDGLLVIAICLGVAIVATAINRGGVMSPLGRALEQSAMFCANYLFFAYFWTKIGQTLGMQAWRLRVQTFDGQRLNWTQSLIRFLGAIISWAPLGLGYLWILFTDERLAWHDRWSQSSVVALPKVSRNQRKNTGTAKPEAPVKEKKSKRNR